MSYVTAKRLRWTREAGIVECIRLEDGAMPQSTDGTMNPDAVERKLHCRRVYRCLSVAESRLWEALSCMACAVVDPMSAEELRDDLHGLAAMLAHVPRGAV